MTNRKVSSKQYPHGVVDIFEYVTQTERYYRATFTSKQGVQLENVIGVNEVDCMTKLGKVLLQETSNHNSSIVGGGLLLNG
jgi:hypothetical protein